MPVILGQTAIGPVYAIRGQVSAAGFRNTEMREMRKQSEISVRLRPAVTLQSAPLSFGGNTFVISAGCDQQRCAVGIIEIHRRGPAE